MKRIAALVLILAGMVCGLGAQARLGIEDAVNMALAKNLDLRKGALDLEALRRSEEGSWSGLFPGVNILGTANFGAAGTGSTTSANATVSLSLDFSALSSLSSTRLAYQAGKLSYESARRAIERDVRKAYYQLLVYDERISIARQNLNAAEMEYDQADSAWKAGLKSELDVKTALVKLESLKPSLDQAVLDTETAKQAFRQLLGIGGEGSFELADGLESAIGGLAFALETSEPSATPSQQDLALRLEEAQAAAGAASANLYTPSFGLTWAYSGASQIGAVQASLGYSLGKLLPGSAQRQAEEKARDQVAKLEMESSATRINDLAEFRLLVASYNNAQKSRLVLKGAIELAQASYDICQKAYAAGTRSRLELEATQSALVSARQRELEASYTLLACCLDLEYLAGLKFGSVGR